MDKKVVIVSGATRGIGATCLRLLAQHDYAAIRPDILPEDRQVAAQINQAEEKYGRADALVNIGSVSGRVGPMDHGMYGATK